MSFYQFFRICYLFVIVNINIMAVIVVVDGDILLDET